MLRDPFGLNIKLQVAALLDSIRKNMDTEFGREQKDRQRIVEAEGLPLTTSFIREKHGKTWYLWDGGP